MEAGAASVGEALAGAENAATDPHLVVTKSTVVPNTTEDRLAPRIADAGLERGTDFLVASNPEFQREGTAVADFLNPDKLVFGTDDDRATALLNELYEPLREAADDDVPVVETGIAEAEMIKYANNTFLATKVSSSTTSGTSARSSASTLRGRRCHRTRRPHRRPVPPERRWLGRQLLPEGHGRHHRRGTGAGLRPCCSFCGRRTERRPAQAPPLPT